MTPDPSRAFENEAKIYIDTREGKSIDFFVSGLMNKYQRENIVIKKLEVGDFHIESHDQSYIVVIERKSAGDFVSSHYGGRLATQTPEVANYDSGVILVHGDLYVKQIWKVPIKKGGKTVWVNRRGFKFPETVTRTISSYGVRLNPEGNKPALLQFKTKDDVIDHLDYYAKLIEDGRLVRQRRDIKGKKKTKVDEFRNTLLNRTASFPNVGYKRAKNIMELAKWSEENLNQLTISELETIDKIGPITATKIWESLHALEYS